MTNSDHRPGADAARPWLLDLATPQRGAVEPTPGAQYDDARQMTYLQQPRVPVIDTDHTTVTKKADRETGEDQKL